MVPQYCKISYLIFNIECRTKVDSDGSVHHTRRFSTDELQQHRVSNGWVQKVALTCKIHSNGVDRWVGANSTTLAKIICLETACYNKKRLAKSSTKGTLFLNISDAPPPPPINTGTHWIFLKLSTMNKGYGREANVMFGVLQ